MIADKSSFEKLIVFIGPERTGSTTLHNFFVERCQVNLSRTNKELFYWDEQFHKGLKWYENQFSGHNSKIYADFTPTIFGRPEVCSRIMRSNINNLHIVITLRHPVERAYSHYLHRSKYGLIKSNFLDTLLEDKVVKASSRYEDNIKKWQKLSKDSAKVTVIIFEHIFSNDDLIQDFAQDILNLNVSRSTTAEIKKLNRSSLPKYEKLAYVAGRVSAYLREHEMYFLVDSLKRLGLKKVIFSGRNVPTLDDKQRTLASRILKEEITFYEALCARSSKGVVSL